MGTSSASPINTPARPRTSTHKNSVPIILSDVDPKFNSVVKLMSELRQFHPSLRVSKVQDIFLLTGLRIYMGEYKAQGPTLCLTEGRALRRLRALYSPV